jgi:hypothetical protein
MLPLRQISPVTGLSAALPSAGENESSRVQNIQLWLAGRIRVFIQPGWLLSFSAPARSPASPDGAAGKRHR